MGPSVTTSCKASSVIPYGLEDKSKPNGHRVVDSIRIYVGIEGTRFRTRSIPEKDLSETTCRYYRRRSRNRDGRGIHYWPNKGSQATRCSKSSLTDIRNLFYEVIVAIIRCRGPYAVNDLHDAAPNAANSARWPNGMARISTHRCGYNILQARAMDRTIVYGA